jgi:pyruvate kinase
VFARGARGASAGDENPHKEARISGGVMARIGRRSQGRRDAGAIAKAQPWSIEECRSLIGELSALRASMLALVQRHPDRLAAAHPAHAVSAVNLMHYLALRRFDVRALQRRLAVLGLSSLGRSETHVLANVNKVLGLLHAIAGLDWRGLQDDEPVGAHRGPAMLERNATALFGPPPEGRSVRIMVTLPSEAAGDAALVRSLVAAGMDVARINCAHDDAAAWQAMAAHVRRAARAAGRRVHVLMDLGGPKLRTGPIEPASVVLRLRPRRDRQGVVTAPARLGLRSAGSREDIAGADACVGVDAAWLAGLEPGDLIDCVDTRSAARRFHVIARMGTCVLLETGKTVYLGAQTRLKRRQPDRRGPLTPVIDLPAPPARIRLQRGDRLRLVGGGVGRAAIGARGLAKVPITLPEALPAMRKGQPVWFDDGRIGAVVIGRRGGSVELKVTAARSGGEWLAVDKGINLPETELGLPALTAKDLDDLAIAARCADLVGLSFVQTASDVRQLRERMRGLGAADLGIVLKVETRHGFEHLPELLFAAMEAPAAGVMIARGDLAVECGWERLAEVQEEILWACEAAHVPVVWATQVLESLAKTGRPSRAEITDAAMGERAECVMLNKGPHIEDAIRALDDIVRRMQTHQAKKSPLLRALKSW